MSKRRRPARAAARVAERTVANAQARGVALEHQKEQQRPARVRHRSAVEILRARNAISAAMADAAGRFEIDFRRSGSVIGQLVASYKQRPRKQVFTGVPDTPEAIKARENVERALAAVGPLADVLLAVVVFDEAPPEWARANGFHADDGCSAVRLALQALAGHYGGNPRPAPYRLAPPVVPAGIPAPPVADPAPRRGSSYRAFLEAQAQGALVGDDLLRDALGFAQERGLLLDGSGGDAAMRQTAHKLEALARSRWMAKAA